MNLSTHLAPNQPQGMELGSPLARLVRALEPPLAVPALRGSPPPHSNHARAERRSRVPRKAYVALVGDPERRLPAKVLDITTSAVGLVLSHSLQTGAALKVEMGGRLLLGKVRYRVPQGSKYLVGVEIFPSWETFIQALLERQANELDRCHAELQTAVSAVSPDLQETLSIVTLHLELLARSADRKAEIDSREFIGRALTATGRLRDLIRDLLSYHSWVIDGPAEIYPVDTESIVGHIVAALPSREGGGQVTHGPLPTVIGNGPQLTALFQNLVSNGLKFNHNPRPAVHISALTAGAKQVFSIRDNGIGIPPRDRKRVFLPFVRLDSAREYEGTGLGLSICRKIVQRHEGRIWVDPDSEMGTVICFTLPAARLRIGKENTL